MNTKPWLDEPTFEQGVLGDLPYVLLRAHERDMWRGYVAVPPGHPYHGLDLLDLDLDVHGGVTWTDDHYPGLDSGGPLWWIGFDCAHGWDYVPSMAERSYEPGDRCFGNGPECYRTIDYARRECERLADQIMRACTDLQGEGDAA